ncbi:MAG TPA: hypothetical protein VMV10_06145 [Pirellulales bacterium]|nr:hypothetical protein [Pirellulales bacterium]
MPLVSQSCLRSGTLVDQCSLRGAAIALTVALTALASAATAEPLTILNPNVAPKPGAAKPTPAAKKATPLAPWPTFAEVQKTAEKHFSTLKKYRKGDLLSQSDVAPVFDQLEKLGWKVADRDEILKQVPGDRELLVRMLRSDDNRVFMRDIERLPGGYDRVDHLSRLSDAETLLGRLAAGPDGYKMIDYMTTTPWGKTMGNMLAQAPHGQGFNQPTGRIYTEQQFIARLKQSYAQADKSRVQTKVASPGTNAKGRKP